MRFKIRGFLFYVFVILLVLNVSYVSAALAVKTLYSDNYPLQLEPGDSKIVFFTMKNVINDDGPINVNVIPNPSEIATFPDDLEFVVPFGEEVQMAVDIEIQADDEIGTQYAVSALFKPEPIETDEGTVQIVTNIEKGIPVIVAGESLPDLGEEEGTVKKKPSTPKIIYLVWVILLSSIIGLMIILLVVNILKVIRKKPRY